MEKLLKGKTRSQIIKEMDKLFSAEVKRRANGICFKCGQVKANAGVSHYYSRKYMGTRWDFDNCAWADWGCHFYHLEHFKQPGEFYHNWMLRTLGEERFKRLEIKAHTVTKFSKTDLEFLLAEFKKGHFE